MKPLFAVAPPSYPPTVPAGAPLTPSVRTLYRRIAFGIPDGSIVSAAATVSMARAEWVRI